jgi:phosphoketolase
MMAGGQDEYDDEEDEESDESKEGKKKDKKKKGGASMFASYEEFAHMLDADDTENNKFDKMHQKRTFSKAMMPKNQAF